MVDSGGRTAHECHPGPAQEGLVDPGHAADKQNIRIFKMGRGNVPGVQIAHFSRVRKEFAQKWDIAVRNDCFHDPYLSKTRQKPRIFPF